MKEYFFLLLVLHQPRRTRLYSKMKLILLVLFSLEAALATTPSKAVLEDWEVRPEQSIEQSKPSLFFTRPGNSSTVKATPVTPRPRLNWVSCSRTRVLG